MGNSVLAEREHSTLSASASHRWLACTASVKFTAGMPDSPSTYAEEGTRAHELCAWKVAEMFKVQGVKNQTSSMTALRKSALTVMQRLSQKNDRQCSNLFRAES